MIRIALASVIVLTIPCVAKAQDSELIADGEFPLLGDNAPFAGASRSWFDGEREEFTFYVLRDRRHGNDRTPYVVVRRELRMVQDWDFPSDDLAFTRIVTWANERTCPGLVEVVRQMAEITPPRPLSIAPGSAANELSITADVIYELRSQFSLWGNRVGYDLMFSSSTGTPLAAWVEDVRSIAEPCWTSEAPSLPEQEPDPTR